MSVSRKLVQRRKRITCQVKEPTKGHHRKRKSHRSHHHGHATCRRCQNEFCVRCVSQFRFPKETEAPQVCHDCFGEFLISVLSGRGDVEEYYEFLENYYQHTLAEKAFRSEEQRFSPFPLFFQTLEEKPKISMAAKMADVAAQGLLRVSGMYEGGQLNRRYVNRISRRKVKFVAKVEKISRHTITVPYRYEISPDYDFASYGMDPAVVLSAPQEGEPETYDMRVNVYRNGAHNDQLQPVIVWMHGGGFVMGDIDDSVVHRTMTHLCTMTGCIVVSVNYRLAPEFRWPTQQEDVYAAVQWVHDQGPTLFGADPNLITVGGDSSGGSLALVTAIQAQRRGGPRIIHQVAVYPGVDADDTDSDSFRAYGDGPFLRLSLMQWFKRQLLVEPNAQCGVHPYLSPLRYPGIQGLPPMTLLTSGYCPMTDHAKKYAERYQAAGIPVTYAEFTNTFHGFFHSFSMDSIQAITLVAISINNHIDVASHVSYHSQVHHHADPAIHHHVRMNKDSVSEESQGPPTSEEEIQADVYQHEAEEGAGPPSVFF